MANDKPVPDTKAKETPTVLTITLENGKFQYKLGEIDGRRSPLRPGETIHFHCLKPFAIEFKGVTPFMKLTRQPDANHKIACSVGSHANVGTYFYTIAAYDDGKVYIDDPELVVEEADPGNTVTNPRPLNMNGKTGPDKITNPRPLPQPGRPPRKPRSTTTHG